MPFTAAAARREEGEGELSWVDVQPADTPPSRAHPHSGRMAMKAPSGDSEARISGAGTSASSLSSAQRESDGGERSSRGVSIRVGCQPLDKLDKLLENNKKWAADRHASDPAYFGRLCSQQSPEYLWIGCADSRVPANVILGLEAGEVFVQRNVGNQATHTDLNVMSCLEYAVTELKVKAIICCGHYGCGAVKAALRMPSKSQGLVNCWISDIRECRNQHHAELKALKQDEQVDRLCELNVMRQTFHVCTSPVVQNAWDQGQELAVYGIVYSLKDGLIRKLVGPLNRENACFDVLEYENALKLAEGVLPTQLSRAPSMYDNIDAMHGDTVDQMINTVSLANKVAQHIGWSTPVPRRESDNTNAPLGG